MPVKGRVGGRAAVEGHKVNERASKPSRVSMEGHGEQGGENAGLQVNSSFSPSFTLSLPFSILSAFSQELAEVGREIFPFYSTLKHSM